ncbi:hypothetical protein QJS04_geneDACA005757 [Acorus gramineus]|uniref:Uncharacterized protein n=1 Tax=Acorus gramineus TaxID=55184 RepID=A0AAV9BIL0_ACOGR|nr:hypothetical protein QJS04_geneDACA005757 [Acorus gramineus]
MTSTSAVILCSAAKSIISCVSSIPPMQLPAMTFPPACICSAFLLTKNSSAPRCLIASSSLLGDVLITVTFVPNALANFTATWPRPPRPTIPTCLPGSLRLKYLRGV